MAVEDVIETLKRLDSVSAVARKQLENLSAEFTGLSPALQEIQEIMKTQTATAEEVKTAYSSQISKIQSSIQALGGVTITNARNLETYNNVLKQASEWQKILGKDVVNVTSLQKKAAEDAIRTQLGLQVFGYSQSKELQIKNLKELLKTEEVGRSDMAGLLRAYIKDQEKDLRMTKLRERAELLVHSTNAIDMVKGFGAKLALGFDATLGKTLGISIGGLTVWGAAAGILIKVLESLRGHMGLVAENMYLAAQSGGLTSQSFNIINKSLQDTLVYTGGFIDVKEVMQLTNIAAKEYGLSLVYLGDSYKKVRDDYVSAQADIISQTTKTVTDLALLAPMFGMTREETVKTMFQIGRDFRIQTLQLAPLFEKLGREAGILQMPVTDLLEPMLKIGDRFRFAGLNVDRLHNQLLELYISTWNARDSFKGLAVTIPDTIEIAKTAIEAFGKMSAESYLAYLGEPISDVGVMFRQAFTADPFQRMIATQARWMDIAKQSGTRDIGPFLAAAIPELQGIPEALRLRIGEALKSMTDEQKKQFKEGKMADFTKFAIEQAPAQERENLMRLAREFELQRDPLKVIIRRLDQMIELFITILYPLVSGALGKLTTIVTGMDVSRIEAIKTEVFGQTRQPIAGIGAMRRIVELSK